MLQVHANRVYDWQHVHFVKGLPDGPINLRFSAQGIHQAGIPTGTFELIHGSTRHPHHVSLGLSGIKQGLNFSDTGVYENGDVLISGVIKIHSETIKALKFEVSYQLDVASLDWTKYEFLSLDEAITAKPEDVRSLTLSSATLFMITSERGALRRLSTIPPLMTCNQVAGMIFVKMNLTKC